MVTLPYQKALKRLFTPLKREGQAAEVADLVVYLASDASTFMTGTTIDINGGTYFS
jgi:3-oxoacyl-[acyl-carrier protein] reductase